MTSSPKLNPAQRSAVDALDGPVLILAGAGAGKTKTLTERIVTLVKKNVAPSKILAITFTNKAASEMRERTFLRLSEEKDLNSPVSLDEKPFVSTFHALGVHIIKENAAKLGLPRYFNIFDKSDSKKAVKESMNDQNIDTKQYDPGKILAIISREKGAGRTLEEYEAIDPTDFWNSLVARVWRGYEKNLSKEKALDFDDLLLKTAKILDDKLVREHYNNVWQYVHIDEFQDTNVVQYEIARKLTEKHENICVVGDIDQNIYSWRGARLKNILDFEKDYPKARVIVLEENYRSTQNILHVANHIIKKNKFRKEKNLFTKNEEGEKISLYEGFDEVSEAEFIATQCEKLISQGVNADEIAVLYRANFQSRVLEEAFLSYAVPYQLIGTEFFDRAEVKNVLSYLRASLERDSLSDLKRIINFPARGIGKVGMLKIFEGKANDLPRATLAKYQNFTELLDKIRERAENALPSETIKFIIKQSGVENEYSDKTDDGAERLENIKELVSIATRYDSMAPREGIDKMLTDAALQSDQDDLDRPRNGVKLMTIHASKGLEFDYVFISGLEEGLFPHERMEDVAKESEEEEEERRLFYVALTRARKKLFLSYAQSRTIYGSRQINIPSEFIYDVPEELVEREDGTYGMLRKPLLNIDF